jgi:hypothetical protein
VCFGDRARDGLADFALFAESSGFEAALRILSETACGVEEARCAVVSHFEISPLQLD